jgi:polysaccharide biosynthesis transport protein
MNGQEQPGILQIVGERKRLFAAILLGFVGIVLFVSWRMTPVYVAKTVVLLETGGPEEQIALVSGINPFRPQSDLNGEYQQLRSRGLADSVVSHLIASGESPAALRDLAARTPARAEWLLEHTKVRPLDGSAVVEIRAYASSAPLATSIANAYADVYVERARVQAQEEVRSVREFLAEQVALIRSRLGTAETTLRDFQQKTGVASLPEETKALVEQLAEAENSHQHAMAELTAHQERLRSLRAQLTTSQDKLADRISEVTTPLIAKLRAELADRIAYREEFLAQGYDPSHAKLQELENQINERRSRLLEALEAVQNDQEAPADPLSSVQALAEEAQREEVEVSSLEARVAALAKSIDGYNRRLATVPQKTFEMGQLAYNADVDQKMLMMLQQRFEEARIEEAGLMGTAKIIDRAVEPNRPLRPDYRLNLFLALALGSVTATFSCLAAHRMNRRIRNVTEAQRLTGWPISGRIPAVSVRDLRESTVWMKNKPFPRAYLRRRLRQVIAAGGLANSFAPWSPVLDGFRALRVRLCRATSTVPQVVLVTSSCAGDGKTMTACNLAMVLANAGSRVLLIDADLRRPQVAPRLGIQAVRGLAELLAERCSLGAAILRTSVPGMDLLPSGKAEERAHDLLASSRMPALLAELRPHYDHIVIDSPPLIPVADATVLCILADTTLVVVRCDQTDCEPLVQSAQILRSLGIPVGGIVFNAERRPFGAKRYYQYYQSYRDQARIASQKPVPKLAAGSAPQREDSQAA